MTQAFTAFPEGEIHQVSGTVIPLKGNDIDTDRIIPARFLKCVSFKELSDHVFADDRKELGSSHPFDLAKYQAASILVVNGNFGCGSSREHAPQALMRWGIRAVIGESFAEIFHSNCLALGIPCATASTSEIEIIQKTAKEGPQEIWSLDLNSKKLIQNNQSWSIQMTRGAQQMLTTGKWDATSQLVAQENAIADKIKNLPYLNDFTSTILSTKNK